MDAFRRYFQYFLQLDRKDEKLLGPESSLYLFTSTITSKPRNIINIGLGSGDAALTLLFACNTYQENNLTCLLPAAKEQEISPQLLAQLELDGVKIERCVDLKSTDHDIFQNRYDLIVVDLSKINTTTDLPSVFSMAASEANLFFFNSAAAETKTLFTEAAALVPSSHWHIDVLTRMVDPHRHPVPDMLAIRSEAPGENRPSLFEGLAVSPPTIPVDRKPIYLALPPPANNFGWGLCSRYLNDELSKLHPVHLLQETETYTQKRPLAGKVFHALTGIRFESIFEHARGEENYAYTFFENELLPESVENAKGYNLVLGGSSWCRERMREKGIDNSGVLIQGIDPRYFHPITTPKPQEKFVIFSGGKFEPRKGQDLVLAAFKALQNKYPDMVLVNCWHNLWPQSMDLMADSKLIRYERKGVNWTEIMDHIYALNGLDPERIFTIDLVPNETQRDLYTKTDIGVFPNRCEGGTNLVLMEYMACAKPVIGAYSTGQKDVLSEDNALLLRDIRPYEIKGPDGSLIARWTEPSLDELVAQIEYAYQNRERIAELGRRAGEDLEQLTWAHTAKSLMRIMGEEVEE